MQVKAKYGIRPDVHGMAIKQQHDTNEEGIKQEHDLAKARQAHAHAVQQMAMQHEHDKNISLLSAIGGQGVGGGEPLGGG